MLQRPFNLLEIQSILDFSVVRITSRWRLTAAPAIATGHLKEQPFQAGIFSTRSARVVCAVAWQWSTHTIRTGATFHKWASWEHDEC